MDGHDSDDDDDSCSSNHDERARARTYEAHVKVPCHNKLEPARDARYCSMTMVLAHVVKNQAMVRQTLDAEFHFTCHVEATDPRQWLQTDWGTRTFCVVDHGDVECWLTKAHEQAQRPEVECVVCLCPARTNTEYFHEIVLRKADEVRFIKGRLKMQGHTKQSPFPSCVVVFGARREKAEQSAAPATVFRRSQNAHVG